MSSIDTPIPLSEIEEVLAWVDTFKLSRPTRKINRDFSDAVLLAEILAVHYPKLVEMHNYPARNSHALKLNNWMTLNRKVLKRLKLTLCTSTMEQLANSAPGIIERVLCMVREKIRRDEELNKSTKEENQNVSSGGSYYEACGDEQILVVPLKTRVNGVLETIHQKVISYEVYTNLKMELKDVKESIETLKQKVGHLDSLIKVKDERIEELQRQLERKQIRRKETEALQNNALPLDLPSLNPSSTEPSLGKVKSDESIPSERLPSTKPSVRIIEPVQEPPVSQPASGIPISTSGIPINKTSVLTKSSIKSLHSVHSNHLITPVIDDPTTLSRDVLKRELITVPQAEVEITVDVVKSDVFKEAEQIHDEIFKDSEPTAITIEDTIQNEINAIASNQQEVIIVNPTKSAVDTAVD